MEQTMQQVKEYKYHMKPLFEERMRTLLPDKENFISFERIIHTPPKNFIRCNTIKITPKDLVNRLSKKWSISQPYPNHPEIILINQNLLPGELGNSIEHLLGYYYVQEISSMMSVLALNPQPRDLILDLFASPGSKTTQLAGKMENQGTIIANDFKMDRIMILASNLERSGITNTLVTRNDAISLCSKLKKANFPKFDKILFDAPCSGEGTLRSSPKTFLMWNPRMIEKLSRMQKKFLAFAIKLLKKDGTFVYSTCTHSPEENEEIIDFALSNFPVKVESLSLPLKCREGIRNWYGKNYDEQVRKCCRIYPHENDSEGFFVCKLTLMEEVE